MLPFIFGPPERRLFGIHHMPGEGAPLRRSVLLCNPFGQEAVRTHRLYKVLAERLARAGSHVLRFDYFGTGDSAGDDADGDLDGWREDIQSAQRELQRRAPNRASAWMGARLGATLCLLSYPGAAPRPERMVLWEPVLDGQDYAQLLRRRHVQTLEKSFSLPDPAWRRRLDNEPDAFNREAIGFELSARLRQQLQSIEPGRLEIPQDADVRLLTPLAQRAVHQWTQTLGLHARLHHARLEHTLDWLSDESLDSALVPSEAVNALVLELDA